MSFQDAAKVMGKQPCTIVQLRMSRCANQFGVLPCVASGTGDAKCFRTRSTCKDTVNYSETDAFVYNFSTTRVSGFQTDDQSPVFPTITSIDTAPTVLTPGKGLGSRASVTIVFQDHPWTDVYSDPYRSERSVDASSVGTFWGKFLARNRYHENRRIIIYSGFLENGVFVASNFTSRTYFITGINGPSATGQVTLQAKDPIKFTDNDKSQFPPARSFILNIDCNASIGNVHLKDVRGELSSSGPIVPGVQPYIRIDNEIMKVTSMSPSAPTTPVVGQVYVLSVNRGPSASSIPAYYQHETNIGTSHTAGASIVPCYEWDSANVADILYQLFIAAGINPSYIEPASTWQADFLNSGLGDYRFTTLLCKPEGIKNLLDEIAQHNVLIWWDERAQLIKCRALVFRSPLSFVAYNETENIVDGSQAIAENAKERMTQVWMYYNMVNPTFDYKKQVTYQNLQLVTDLSLESQEKYGQKQVSTIFSRWLESDATIANQIATRRLQRYKDAYHVLTFETDAKDSIYWTGDTIRVGTSLLQDEFGSPKQVNYLITQADEVISSNGIKFRYTVIEQLTYEGPTALITHQPGTTIPVGSPASGEIMASDYSAASATQKASYVFIGYPSGIFPDGQPSYTLV